LAGGGYGSWPEGGSRIDSAMICDCEDALACRLLLWSALSIVTGAGLVASGLLGRGTGLQALARSAMYEGIAIAGRRSGKARAPRWRARHIRDA
jgi:hypothetical protein